MKKVNMVERTKERRESMSLKALYGKLFSLIRSFTNICSVTFMHALYNRNGWTRTQWKARYYAVHRENTMGTAIGNHI